MWTSRHTNIGIKPYIDKEKCALQVPIFKVNGIHMRTDANIHLTTNDNGVVTIRLLFFFFLILQHDITSSVIILFFYYIRV